MFLKTKQLKTAIIESNRKCLLTNVFFITIQAKYSKYPKTRSFAIDLSKP